MGVVYRGTDLRLGRPVAIKLIASEYATDGGVRRRFEREARLMAAIDHPNVIPVYAAGEQDGHLYLVMRYVPGTDLHGLLKKHRRLPPKQAARIVDELAKALDAAHAHGLVHRDIKPANVLLAREHVYLTDFGITRAVDSGTRVTDSNGWVGTVDFMSPEHLRGEMTDARSDVYSLGCLLYTCLTGSPPFHRDSAAATILAHIEDSPPPASLTPGVPQQFDAVIARAVAKRPAARYPSAGELGRAALAAADGRFLAPRPRRLANRLISSRRNGARAEEDEATAIVLTRADAAPRTASPPGRSGARTRVMPAPSPPVHDRPLSRPTKFVSRRRQRSIALAAGLLTVAGATGVVLAARTTTPNGPLSATEVANTARAFATAYGHRDAGAMSRLVAADVSRISATATEHGRLAVVAEYRRQFASNPIRVYELQGLVVTPGWVGRAAARYTVRLAGHGTIDGTVVFGVERVNGHVVIGLITTQPSG
jgi:predicted Ser/Thr protein kinase